ncbi:MAG: DegT/DnrJ/EryC1/StrS family aminotransferase [Proteobacteria bacterium]|nr:DegT/DnrJ/EryC1/StrS family aminotransferase [Pseudomonadota bacterium]
MRKRPLESRSRARWCKRFLQSDPNDENTMTYQIPLCKIDTNEKELATLANVLASGNISKGRYNHELEQGIERLVGQSDVVLTSSCYGALHAVLHCLGIAGEVIVPSFTFSATVNAIHLTGATPVFADVDPSSRNVTVKTIREEVTSRTKAIMVVHFAGQVCNMGPIMELAAEIGVPVIEDCAQAIGASRDGRQAGSFGIGCFSFFATKGITTGEGGCVATSDRDLADAIRRFIGHGIVRDDARAWRRETVVPGMNFRMSNLAAAIGTVQLAELRRFTEARNWVAQRYSQGLVSVPDVSVPIPEPRSEHAFQMYTICVPSQVRDHLVAHLNSVGIEASVHFSPPVHRHAAYLDTGKASVLPGTDQLADCIVSLPIFPGMTTDEIDTVIAQTESFFSSPSSRRRPQTEEQLS